MPLKHFKERTLNIPTSTMILSLINAGYFLNSINILRDSRCDIELQLPWRTDVYFRANIISKFPFDIQRKCLFTLHICANSYFLHCISKIASNSDMLDANIQRFSVFLNETRTYLYFMESFSSFNIKPICSIPNFINNGLKPMLSPTNQPCDKIDKIPKKFFDFWKRTLDLEYLICLHTTKINVLLEHDYPFPEYLSTPDPFNNKYSSIQCREGLVQLSTLINKNFCSFIVKENSVYVKFFMESNVTDTPSHFCVIKLLVKDFEVTLLLYFFIQTPESVRDEFVTNLANSVSNLKFPPRGKQARPRHMSSQMSRKMNHVPPQQRSWDQINCCIVLNLDIDNLIATYNPIKSVDPITKRVIRHNKLSLTMVYLEHQCHHDYAIWSINQTFMKNVFETLIKLRLQEGFHFANHDTSSGFINLVKEIKLLSNTNEIYHCFVQYMIYLDSTAKLDEMICSVSSPTSLSIFTEMLIEKKYGFVTLSDPEVVHWNGLSYEEIPKQIIELDRKCLETFVTFEGFQIYPATLPRTVVKPNICSVLQNSVRAVLQCPLYSCDDSNSLDTFRIINQVLLESLDSQLKQHGFQHIDITKTENRNFNELIDQYEPISELELKHDPDTGGLVWHCYFLMRGHQNLIVVMLPSNYCQREDTVGADRPRNIPVIVYGMSLKHLAFMIEDRWTLRLPPEKRYQLPLLGDHTRSQQVPFSPLLPSTELNSANNEFAVEIEQISLLMVESVKKLDSIYVLSFVAGAHSNLRDNRLMSRADLVMVFDKYCRKLAHYEVDATKFMDTVCSHCHQSVRFAGTAATHDIAKDTCETKAGMHARIVRRIRTMVAKYFKEIPGFPQTLIYCPDNEDLDDLIVGTGPSSEFRDSSPAQAFDEDDLLPPPLQQGVVFLRQHSTDPTELDLSFMPIDSGSEIDATSISSIAIISGPTRIASGCPLFIFVRYTLRYGDKFARINLDTVPTCIGEFFGDVVDLAGTDIEFSRLQFHLDMIPMTVVVNDDDNVSSGHTDVVVKLARDGTGTNIALATAAGTGDNYSLIANGSGKAARSKKISANIGGPATKYLSARQTQLLNSCRNEFAWTLDDEIVNCQKYLGPIEPATVDMVMRHIDKTLQHKWHKHHAMQIRKRLFELEFVFGFDKCKALFQDRFEKMSFGKHDQYRLEKIGTVYCVFQKSKPFDEHLALGLGLFPNQTITEMDDVFMQSRLRYATMCLDSSTANEATDTTLTRKWASEGKLNPRSNYLRKMSAEAQERQSSSLFNTDKQHVRNPTDLIKPIEFAQTPNIVSQCNPYNITRHIRSPMPYPINQHFLSFTPKRHRSGEASSTIFTGNCRSDTPMLLNDLISTATSSKGYEGDSSRVSDGEEYDMIDHFSNPAAENKIEDMKSEMAPFWLLLNIVDSQKQIEVYFHHTDNCLLTSHNFSSCEHCNSFELIFDKFEECVHQVNQCLLLEQLAQTRICRDILVPEDSPNPKISSMSQLIDCDYDDESLEFSKKFSQGAFACPRILKINFRLHSRLRGSPDKNGKATSLLRSGLENIAVLNRKNMLIFVDDNTKGIFYSIIREITGNLDQEDVDRLNENSVLVTYSNSQLSKSIKLEDRIQHRHSENLDILSIKSAPSICDLKSLNKPFNNVINQFRNIDLLELSIHGVDKLTETTTTSIISNIGSKLDMIVLRQLSDSIYRSRNIMLNKEDIDFLLSEDFNNKPQKPQLFSWSLPKLVIENKLVFCYYLKQNLQFAFISPKICNQALSERLYVNSESFGEVYLYNQTSAQGISNEVIGLFTIQLLTGSSNAPCVIKDCYPPEFQLTDDNCLDQIITNNYVREIEKFADINNELDECHLNFNLWSRGVFNVENIKKKFLNAIQSSLNDLVMEYIVIPSPISSFDEELLAEIKSNSCRLEKSAELDSKIIDFENGEKGNLNKLFADNLFFWTPELSKCDGSLLKFRRFEMFSDFNVEFLLHDIVESMKEFLNFKVFYYENNIWHIWNGRQPKSGKDYPGMKRSFIIIGRVEELWKRYVAKRFVNLSESDDVSLSNSQTSLSFTSSTLGTSTNSSASNHPVNNIKELRKVRTLLKQLPNDFSLLNTSTATSTTNLLNSNSHNSGMPEFCSVKISNTVIIPRQMLCIIKIHGCQVDTISYNLVKEISDHLYSSIDTILSNHKSRFQMLNSFIYQKLGLFYECSSKSCLQGISVNTIKSLVQIPPIKTRTTNSNVGELNRERQASGSARSFSPSYQMVNKIISNNQNKPISNKVIMNKSVTVNINLSRIYQDAYIIYQLYEIKKNETFNDVIYQHAIQFLNTHQLESKRRILSKKIRQSISSLQPATGFKQIESSEMDSLLQQLEVLSCLKRACRLFHSVVCPILFIPRVRKRFVNSLQTKVIPEKTDQKEENNENDDWIHEISRLVLAYYADYLQKEHGFQYINPPRPNMSQGSVSHALFQRWSNNSGINIIEVFILKDCLCVRLNLLEIRRLNNCVPGLSSSSSTFQHIQHVQKSFVKDACKFCDLTHLMSFMYDVYVRMIAKSISYPEENKKSFTPISFMRDLIKIYSQPPLYSTSHIYLMPFPVPNDIIKPDNLFQFLQRHYEDYNFSINNTNFEQFNTDTSTAFLYNIFEERYSYPIPINTTKKISPESSSPLDMSSSNMSINYKYLENVNEWDLTSIFCLTRSQTNPDSTFDLFIVTFNRSHCFPRQRLISLGNSSQKPSIFLANYLTILPHHSSHPANLLHTTPCPISLTHIDANNIPESIAWRTYENRSIVPLQVPLFLTLRSSIDKYFKENYEKFSMAITDCHKDSLWHRMYQRWDIGDSSKFSLTFEEFQDLIKSGDIVDILELDNRLSESMKIAASYLKELNDYMGILSDDCYTVFYENTNSIYRNVSTIVSSHLVLMSKKTKDGFLLLTKNQDINKNSDNYDVELKAVFQTQDCRNRIPLQHKYYSSSLREMTVMLAETAAFCIWRKLAMKPLGK